MSCSVVISDRPRTLCETTVVSISLSDFFVEFSLNFIRWISCELFSARARDSWQKMFGKFLLFLERNLRITTRMSAIVMIMAMIQNRCDRPAPMSSKFSWFFTMIGVSKKLRAIPIWAPNMLNDVAVESSLAANHCAARRPGNVRTIVYNIWIFITNIPYSLCFLSFEYHATLL